MKLLDYMRAENLDDQAMAGRIGGCSAHAVKKWKYGERSPDPDRIIRIEEVTGGKVSLRDWSLRNRPPRAFAENEAA
jgi:DNA-binding transcriptional regulator YdaS (Cro superfamily)